MSLSAPNFAAPIPTNHLLALACYNKKMSNPKNEQNSLISQIKQTLAEEETFWGRVKNFYENEPLMTRIGIVTSLLISLFFIITNLWNGFANDASWPILLASYYIFIDVINGLLLKNLRANHHSANREKEEVRRIGYLMVGLDFIFLAILSQMIISDAKESYNIMIIVANSVYMVYRIAIAIYNMVRTRHLTSPTLVASKHIAMIAALISATVLQASVVEYISGNEELIRLINSIVGVTVFAINFLLSALLIRRYQEPDIDHAG